MDKLGDIDLFVRVVRNAGLAAAGREVGLSPASMSARINRMENHYGTRLLNRSTRHVSPTEAGHIFYDRCIRILSEVSDAELLLQTGRETFKGPLKITATIDVGRQHVTTVLKSFIQQHKEVEPYLHLTDYVINVIEEDFDLAIRYGQASDGDLIVRKLANSRRMLCASPKYLEQNGEPKLPNDLNNHDCLVIVIDTEPLTTWNFYKDNETQSININPSRSCNNGEVIRQWAIDGEGIAMKSYIDIAADLKAGRLVTVLDQHMKDFNLYGQNADLHVVCPSRKYVPHRVSAFIDELTEYFSKLDI